MTHVNTYFKTEELLVFELKIFILRGGKNYISNKTKEDSTKMWV